MNKPKLKFFSEIQATNTEFLVGNCIPKQSITLLVGDGGIGKSLIECHIAAALSCGKTTVLDVDRLPFEEDPCHRRTTLLLMAEDDASRVIAGRLQKCEADLTRIATPEPDYMMRCKLKSQEMEDIIASFKPDLVIIDPLQSFLPRGVQMSQRNEMRDCLEPLNTLAEKYGTTFLITVHTNKRMGASGRNRMADSSDIWDIARSVLIVGKTGENGINYISHEKSNYGELQETVLYRVKDGKIESSGTTQKKDFDFVSDREPRIYKAPKREEAADFIVDQLRTHDKKMQVKDLDAAAKAAGFTASTLSRAKTQLYKSKAIVESSAGNRKEKQHFIELMSDI